MTIKLNIEKHEDRVAVVKALADSGYKTWVETITSTLKLGSGTKVVCAEIPEEDIIK